MWISRADFEKLAREAGAASFLSAENALLRAESGRLRRRLARVRQQATPDPVPAVPASDGAFLLSDGLPPVVERAIEDFAGGDLTVARHLATVARRRLVAMPKVTDEAIHDLADAIASGADPDGVM